jgi:WD40 repeat protein
VHAVIQLWNPKSDRQLDPEQQGELTVSYMHFAADRRSLIIEGTDGSVRVWDWMTGHERRCWRAASDGWLLTLPPITLSPDGRLLAEAIDGQTIRLREVETNKNSRTLHTTGNLWSLAFSPDGEILVSHATEGIQLWSVRTGTEVEIGGARFGRSNLLLFSPEGRWIESQPLPEIFVGQAVSDVFYLWDRITGRVRRVIKGQHNWLSLHSFSPDGRILAGTDGSMFGPNQFVLWETATGGERLRRPAFGKSIDTMAFSPDGRTLALGCGDGTIRLWDVATGEVQQSLPSDQGAIHALAFSNDGAHLASAGTSRKILIWDVRERRQRTGKARTLSREALAASWRDMADFDAARPFEAQQTLARAPQSAMAFLHERLRPIVAPEPRQVQRLIVDLNSDSYPVREQEMRQLEQLGDGVEVYLRQTLEQRPSLEVRRRVEQLLEMLVADSPEHLRNGRALEVLEWLNTPNSRQLLDELAHGAPDAWVTREAKASLRHLVSISP